ncbi:MAG TPA: hypothetical protein VKB86_02575 [Pyrinomonadaceae bacterium]|nr:hypothetical protein [Pyrinomonadaceae bacterium]
MVLTFSVDNRKHAARILVPTRSALAGELYPEGDPISMNKRAKFSLAIFVLGLIIQFSPAQSQTPTQPLTRPRTVTTQTTQPTSKTQTVSQTPTTATLPAAQTAGAIMAQQPWRPLSMNKLRARLDEAKRILKSKPALTAMTAPDLSIVTLAVLDEKSSQIHLVKIPKDDFLHKGAQMNLTSSLGMNIQLTIIRANGVNTAVTAFDAATGRTLVPLVVEYPIERGGALHEMAYYTSAHPALLSPDVVKTGQAYVHMMLDLAARRLRDKGVPIPSNIVDIAERLCVVEHTDHTRFRVENRQALFEEILSLYALNELDTFRHSVSFAGAGGMVQMIPSTYQMLRREHPGIGLNPDFVYGMQNHGNALEAMLLYMLDTWKLLTTDADITAALSSGTATLPELMAAGYNSNPAKLGSYIRRGGSGWRTLIPRETQTYLQVYHSLETLIPMKSRS